eukprot:967620-Amorphochlora_amoeboformis.AAC.1
MTISRQGYDICRVEFLSEHPNHAAPRVKGRFRLRVRARVNARVRVRVRVRNRLKEDYDYRALELLRAREQTFRVFLS